MQNLAKKLDASGVYQEVGTIARAEDAAFVVRTETSEFRARRAVSCLVEPVAGDYVLVSHAPNGAYVLAVLEREEGAGARLVADGDLEVRLANGRFGVVAAKGVDVVSSDLDVTTGTVKVNAGEGHVVVQKLSYLGTLVRAEVEKVKVVASVLDQVLDRFSQKVKRSYRTVEDYDQLRAERIDYEAKKTMTMHAGNAVVTADELVKIDGEQIHLG